LTLGSWRHLVVRFFRVIFARPLTDAEKLWVASHLGLHHEPFFAQSRADQRHGYETARRVGEGRQLIKAALLHDVGKRHSALSPIGRVIVSVASKLHLPVGRRGRLYLDHGRLGAEELASSGCDPFTVAFAAHHHGRRPESIAPADWDVLTRADR
jgi:putative nucleotidyltransferase with HDIG domain